MGLPKVLQGDVPGFGAAAHAGVERVLAGQMTFTYETRALAADEGLYLIVCSVAPGSRDADALNLLAAGTPPATQKSQRSNKPELALTPRNVRRVSGFSSHGGVRCSAGAHKSSRSWSVRSSPAAESRIVAGLLAPASGTMFGDCWRSQATRTRCGDTPRRLARARAAGGIGPAGPPNGE